MISRRAYLKFEDKFLLEGIVGSGVGGNTKILGCLSETLLLGWVVGAAGTQLRKTRRQTLQKVK